MPWSGGSLKPIGVVTAYSKHQSQVIQGAKTWQAERGNIMGMRSYWAGAKGRTGGSYQSGGTSSFPVTGFPSTAYLGNNRRYMGGGPQSQPSPMARRLVERARYDPRHSLILIVALIAR